MKQLLLLVLMLSSIPVSAQIKRTPDTTVVTVSIPEDKDTVYVTLPVNTGIQLPKPAGSMTVEEITSQMREEHMKMLKLVAEKCRGTEPYLAIILHCILSHMNVGEEKGLADKLLQLTGDMLSRKRSAIQQ